MPWLKLRFVLGPEQVEPVSEALEAEGAIAVSIEADSLEPLFQAVDEPGAYWRECALTALLPEHIDAQSVLAHLRQKLAPAELPNHSLDVLADQDWARAWMARYRPIEITPQLWVCPSWIPPPKRDAVNIVLDPGTAFGTGEHPTTALCLQWLARLDVEGRFVVDYGCGSGILAIAALKLGAARALGVDIDPQALAVSRENAQRNGVAARYQALAPDALDPRARADILIANILSGPLFDIAEALTERVKPGGFIALSGFLRSQVAEMQEQYPAFELDCRFSGEWALLAGAKISGDDDQR